MQKLSTIGIILVFGATILSGCFGDESGAEQGATDPEPSAPAGTQDPNATLGEVNASVPVATILVYVEGNATSPENGSIAFVVGSNVTFDASSSSGDGLTYFWELGDGNTSSEPIVEQGFPAAGNFTVTLTVTDTHNQTANASVDLVVEPGIPPSGTVVKEEKKTFTGTITVGVYGPDLHCGTGVSATINHNWVITAAEPDGTPTMASRFVLKMASSSATNVDADLFLYDPTGKEIGSGTTFSPNENIDITGTFKPGTYKVTVQGCTTVNGAYSIAGTATYVVP